MPFLNFKFAMIYIIQKMFVLLKTHLNYLKDNIFVLFFKDYDRLLLLKRIHNI